MLRAYQCPDSKVGEGSLKPRKGEQMKLLVETLKRWLGKSIKPRNFISVCFEADFGEALEAKLVRWLARMKMNGCITEMAKEEYFPCQLSGKRVVSRSLVNFGQKVTASDVELYAKNNNKFVAPPKILLDLTHDNVFPHLVDMMPLASTSVAKRSGTKFTLFIYDYFYCKCHNRFFPECVGHESGCFSRVVSNGFSETDAEITWSRENWFLLLDKF